MNTKLASENPSVSGLDVVDLSSHRRRKRALLDSVWDGLTYKMEAPMEDWRKLLGTTDFGASFGVTLMNLLDLHIGTRISIIKLLKLKNCS